jgi:ATP-dependent RNA helicase DDX18/HAS1
VEEFDFPKKKLINVQSQIEKVVSKNFDLHQSAKDGYRLVSSLARLHSEYVSMMRTYGPCC